jgi:hypothetical protein
MTDLQEFSVDSARASAHRDELDDWVHGFLSDPEGGNPELCVKLDEPPRSWTGPHKLPIDQLNRLAGPPGHPVLVEVDEDDWRGDVDDMEVEVLQGGELPPVVVTCKDGQLVVEDGNHRIEGLRRAGATWAWAVVGFESVDDAMEFRPPEID